MKKIFFFSIIILCILQLNYALAESNMVCEEQELINEKLIVNCHEIKTTIYNTTRPKINITFGEVVTIYDVVLKRLGDLDYNLSALAINEYFGNFSSASTYELENIVSNQIYQPAFLLSDGVYLFQIKAFNIPNIYVDVAVFFKVNASQMNFWVEQPANHSIPKPDFAASSTRFNNLTIKTERETEACKYSPRMSAGSADYLFNNVFVDEFNKTSSTQFKLENFDFASMFSSNSTHNFNAMDVICKETAQAFSPARYSYKKIRFVYLNGEPTIQIVPNPARVIDYMNRYSILNISTSQTTACTINVPNLQNITGQNPAVPYNQNFLFNKLDYYALNELQQINFSHRPSPYEFNLNITCTNLANISSSKIQKIEVDYAETAEFKFITPKNYINTKTINVSGTFITDNITCEAKFNNLTELKKLDYISQQTDGRFLYQKSLQENTLVEGKNTVAVRCELMPPEVYETKVFTLDTKPPTNMTINTNANTCSLSHIKATLSAKDENAMSHFEYELTYQGTKQGDFNRNGTTSGTINVPIQGLLLENESYKIRARPFDEAGNAGSWVETIIKITNSNLTACDFTPPTITINQTYDEILKNWKINVSCKDAGGCKETFTWGINTNLSGKCNSTTNNENLKNLITISQQGVFCATVYDLNNNNASRTITLNKTYDSLCAGKCGGVCPRCELGAACTKNTDCESNYCFNNTCSEASCDDKIHNGYETDVDCGGSCKSCDIGKNCTNNADCISKNCDDGICAAASCTNDKIDGNETDLNCGGPDCDPCALNKKCKLSSDCESGQCINGICSQIPQTIPESKTGPSTLGLIFLILGVLSGGSGGALLYLENDKKKHAHQEIISTEMKAALNQGMPRVTTLNDKQPIIKQLTPQEYALRKQQWEDSQKLKDKKRKEMLESFEEKKPTDTSEEKTKEKADIKTETKPKIDSKENSEKEKENKIEKPQEPKKEKLVNEKKDYLEFDELQKKEDAFEQLKQKTQSKSSTDDEDLFNKLKDMNTKHKKQKTKNITKPINTTKTTKKK